MKAILQLIAATAVLLLNGCGGIELNEQNPANIRLTGDWVLDASASDSTPDLKNGLKPRRTRSRDQTAIRQREIRGALGSGFAFIVHDFQILSAKRIEIELNHDSMGIQYEPGVYRDVSWGQRDRSLWSVYAGWEEDELVIISPANDMRVVERHARRGNELHVSISIKADKEERTLNRVFTRA